MAKQRTYIPTSKSQDTRPSSKPAKSDGVKGKTLGNRSVLGKGSRERSAKR